MTKQTISGLPAATGLDGTEIVAADQTDRIGNIETVAVTTGMIAGMGPSGLGGASAVPANTFLAGPATGNTPAKPTYRTIQLTDLPSLGPVAQGRLLPLASPPNNVVYADVASTTAIYYRAFVGNTVIVWSGLGNIFNNLTIGGGGQMTLNLDPAVLVGNSVFDVFAYNNNDTLGIGFGPAWTSASGRSAAVALIFNGVSANIASIVLSTGVGTSVTVPPQQATLLGTIRTLATAGTTCFVRTPATSTSVVNPCLGYIWNMYNRRPILFTCRDGMPPYSNFNSTTTRIARGNVGNAIQFVTGSQEEHILVEVHTGMQGPATLSVQKAYAVAYAGAGYDGTTFNLSAATNSSNSASIVGAGSVPIRFMSTYLGSPILGFHSINRLEQGDGLNFFTFDTPNDGLLDTGPDSLQAVIWM